MMKITKSFMKELVTYCLFGTSAFFVCMATFYLCDAVLGIDVLIGNVISWLVATEFAFITNRRWVFAVKTHRYSEYFKKMGAFFGGRVFSLLVEEVMIFIFITRMHYPSLLIKCIAQLVVNILNYLVSKKIVFRKKKPTATTQKVQ